MTRADTAAAREPPDRFAWGLRLDAARRLGPRPVLLWLGDRAARAAGLARMRLPDLPLPPSPFLPAAGPPAPALPAVHRAALLATARAVAPVAPGDHPPPASGQVLAHALHLDTAGARTAWEAARLAWLPLLAQAARIEPGAGHLARAEAWLAAWVAANPPFRGLGWACGQEAAFRALHLASALALLGADRAPPPGARALLAACARRIAATPLYALAQDNNHPISEAAGAFACALLLGQDPRRPAAALSARVARLVAPDGGFAQVSAGYARLALDTLALAEWLRRRHAAPPFPAPLATRAAALTRWLHALACPETGATPPLGLEDGSALGDLSLAGPADAGPSLERAARLFCGPGADRPDDPGCAWLGLAAPAARLARPARLRAAGTLLLAAGGGLAVLRGGKLRFRPAQSDLLHVSLRLGRDWLLRDGGTGAYAPGQPGWEPALWGAAAHNAPVFDGREPMPRAGRFLPARWPALRDLPDGAAARDHAGCRTARTLRHADGAWWVEDALDGPFGEAAWHWRLPPAPWRLTADGVAGGPGALMVRADAPLSLALVEGREAPGWGEGRAVPVLRVVATVPVARVTTRVVPA